MAGDWIRIYRRLMDHAVWSDEWLVKLFIWCLLKANYRDGKYLGQPVRRGQFITGRITAADDLGCSQSKWYRGIMQLKELGCVNVRSNNKRTVITVCNYKSYQSHGSKYDESVNNDSEQQDENANTPHTTELDIATSGDDANTEQHLNSKRTATEQPLNSKRTTNEHKSKKNKKGIKKEVRHDVSFPDSVNTPECRDAWEKWLNYKSTIGKPYKAAQSIEEALKRVADWGPDRMVEAIRYSIGQDWTGIFEERDRAGKRKPKATTPDALYAPGRDEDLAKEFTENLHG